MVEYQTFFDPQPQCNEQREDKSRDLINGRVNSKHCEIKIIRQRDTDKAHHKSLHDKRGTGIITRTAESFLDCHMVLLSKSHVSKNCDTHKTVL